MPGSSTAPGSEEIKDDICTVLALKNEGQLVDSGCLF